MSTEDNAGRGGHAAAGGAVLTWFACLFALATAAGSVYLSVGMGLKACPLCFYQRTFVFAVFGVMLVGLLVGTPRSGLSLLCLPLAVGGLGVAGFHVFLELNGTLECPKGILGVGTAPQQSLAALAVLTVLLGLAVVTGGTEMRDALPALAGTVLLGALFAVAAIISAPPLPAPKPPTGPFDMCRPPYSSPGQLNAPASP